MTKICNTCDEAKALTDFSPEPRNLDGKKGKCKSCYRIERARKNGTLLPDGTIVRKNAAKQTPESKRKAASEWYYRNREEVLRRNKLLVEYNPYIQQERKMVREFGEPKERMLAMLSEQNSACAICMVQFSKDNPPNIDHCHESNKVRSLLCRRCNTGLGHFQDDTELMLKAVEYLQLHANAL